MVKTEIYLPPELKTDSDKTTYIIDIVIRTLVRKFKFAYFSYNDIYQEAWAIAAKAIQDGDYDPNRPLEKFMYVHIKRRLFNFVRDKYSRQTSKDTRKKNLMNPAPNSEFFDVAYTYELSAPLEYKELYDHIYNNLPKQLRDSYAALVRGESIDHKVKLRVRAEVRRIIDGEA